MNEKLPDKTFFKIDAIYAFIADHPGSGEGIMGFLPPGHTVFLPMIGADLERVKDLKPIADGISKAHGIPYKIYKFTEREVFEL